MAELFDLAVMRREIEEDERICQGGGRPKRSDYVSQDELEKMWRRKWDSQQRNDHT